jgi:hypothetical protein
MLVARFIPAVPPGLKRVRRDASLSWPKVSEPSRFAPGSKREKRDALTYSGCFEDTEAFDLFKKLESRPAIEVMQDQKAVEIAIYLLVDSIEGF